MNISFQTQTRPFRLNFTWLGKLKGIYNQQGGVVKNNLEGFLIGLNVEVSLQVLWFEFADWKGDKAETIPGGNSEYVNRTLFQMDGPLKGFD